MEMLLLLSLMWAGSLQGDPGYELRVQDSVTVQEGLCVHVPCSFSYPGVGGNNSIPAYGSWYRIKDNPKVEVLMATNNSARGTKRKTKLPLGLPGDLPGDPGTGDCSLSITDARRGHSGNYYFHLDRGLMKHSYKSNRLTVRVRALTQTPDIQVKEPLESGRPSHLTCSVPGACDRAMPLTISWTGAALSAPGLNLEASNSSEILLIPCLQDHGTNLTCGVTFPRAGVSTQTTIMLNISYTQQNLSIGISQGNCTELKYLGNGSSLPVLEGESLLLVCAADSNPPATLSWAQRSRALGRSQPWEPGVLELPRVQLGDEGKFTCQAQNSLGSRHISLHLSVVNPPRLLSPSCSWEGEGLCCSCSSQAQPAPTLSWRLGEMLLEGNYSTASWTITSSSAGPWANGSLFLSGPLGSGLRLSCEARNAHGEQGAAVLLLPGKPELGGGFVLGAVRGAGVIGLLSLCPCLIFFMAKICRKQAPQPVAGEMDAACMLGSLSWGCQPEYPGGFPLAGPPPALAPPSLKEEPELYYASFTFPGRRPWEPQDPEIPSTTEYSEIKICK